MGTDIDWECGKDLDTTVQLRVARQLLRGQIGGKGLDSGDLQNGDELFMWDCPESKQDHPNQLWTGFNGQIRAINGHLGESPQKCMDVPNGDISKGVRLQVWDCLGIPQQQFSYDTDTGLLHVSGTDLCVDSPGGGVNNADAIWLWDCDGSQAWDFVDLQESTAVVWATVAFLSERCALLTISILGFTP